MAIRDQAIVEIHIPSVEVVSMDAVLGQFVEELKKDEGGDHVSAGSFRENWQALPEDRKRGEYQAILKRIPDDTQQLGLFECDRYINEIVSLIDRETVVGREMASDLFDFIYEQYGEKVRPRWDNLGFARGSSEPERVAMMFMLEPGQEDLYLRVLAENRDDEKWNEKVGMLIKARGMPALADRLRFLLGYGAVRDEAERAGLEFVLRDILGYPELEEYYRAKGELASGEHLPLPLSLSEVYENYDFGRYPVSLETEKFRMKNLVAVFKRFGIGKEARICDAGCGTGWLTGELAEAGFTSVSGVEIDPVNLARAKELYPKVEFIQGAIEEMEILFKSEKMDVVLELGRTGTHAEDWDGLRRQMVSINEALEMGGYLVMDWPNPKAKGGIYEEYTDCVRKAYERHGFTDREMEGLEVVVDGPATASQKCREVYNRLAPDVLQDGFKWRMRSFGFEVMYQEVEELPNGTGKDENVVMVLKKVTDFEEPGARLRALRYSR